MVATVFGFLDFEENDLKLLKELGYEIHTGTNMMDADWLKNNGELDHIGMINHQIDFGRTPFSKQSLLAYKQLKKLLGETEFDLIHCHTPVASAILRAAVKKSGKRRAKVIYTAHGFHFHKRAGFKNWLLYYPIERIMARKTDMIITINREDYAVIRKFKTRFKRYVPGVGVDVRAIAALTPDRQTELLERYNVPKDAFVVMTVGELSDRKNQKAVIRAMSILRDPDVYYLIVGAGSKREELANEARRLGVEDRVIFAGRVPHGDVLRLGHLVDLGVVPSLIEGLGLAGIEMLSAGTPLIGSKVQGIKDYVIEGETGILCDPENPKEFAHAIKRMKEDKAYYDLCKGNAIKVARRFDVKRVEQLMRENYLSVLNS